ncbi:MAG: InlB B-repeat-containing protein, partial [Clostridia bacterium]|nr:InlB B-repeat-containing protein [Clostridia bacterium]
LYAQWSYSGTSTITFDAQGGTTTLKTLTATYGSNTNNRLDTATNPVRVGYTFDGWFDDPTGGTQVYKVSNGSCIAGDYWTKSWEDAGTGATWKGPKELTLYAHWIPKKYTVTWKNYDGQVLETDTGVAYNSTPSYNGATPTRAEDENFTYTFKGWSPTVSAVTDNVVYTAQFTAISKRVEPSYTVIIPATVNEGESVTVSATNVILNTDEILTVTIQSDFTLKNEQNATLAFKINGGDVTNNAVVLSVAGNGDKNTPLSRNSNPLTIEVAEEAKYSGTYTGHITFTIAVNTAENNQ